MDVAITTGFQKKERIKKQIYKNRELGCDDELGAGLVPIGAPERRLRCLRTVHPDNRANEVSMVGGVDGT